MIRARALLAAVNDDFLDGVALWLADEPLLELVGRAHSGAETLQRVDEMSLDLVLADVALPDMSGFEVVRRIKSRPDPCLVVLLSFHDSQAARLEALAAGADGFVAMSETVDRLIPLVGDLLRRRAEADRNEGSGIPTTRVKNLRVGGP